MTWEPFESIPVMEGYGFFAKNLEYGSSKAVGAELGMIMATKTAADSKKRGAVERFVWAYLQDAGRTGQVAGEVCQMPMPSCPACTPNIAAEASKVIKLGEVISPDQIKRQAKAFADLGVIQKDVSGQIEANWDGSFVSKALGK